MRRLRKPPLRSPRRRGGCRAAVALTLASLTAACTNSASPPAAQAPASQPAPARPTPDEQSRLASVVESIQPWQFNDTAGKLITTAHYRLFTTEKDAVIVDRAPRFLELAINHYTSTITPLPPPPLRLDSYLMDNRGQWKRLVLQTLGTEGQIYLNIPRGGFATGGRAFLYDIGVFDTMSIAAHEGWHQYTQRTFAEPLPIWLEEGLATYMEGHKWDGSTPVFLPWANIERFDQLRTAHAKGELLPLAKLLDTAPQDLLMHVGDAAVNYYAQVWALTHFLAEGGGAARRSALAALLTDFATGRGSDRVGAAFGRQASRQIILSRRGGQALMAYVGTDLDALGREYDTFIAELVRPGSRGPITAGQSPLSPKSPASGP